MIPRDEIIKAYPLKEFLEKQGAVIKQNGAKEHVCCCLFHNDRHPSMSLNFEKGLWHCFPCDFGGSVIDLYMRLNNMSVKEALFDMAEKAGLVDPYAGKEHTTNSYRYKDAYGRDVMEVDRIEKDKEKKFLQSRINEKGEKILGVEGVQRVLYRMDQWAGLDRVCLAEGEKCVHAIESLGEPATTNPGGSGGWLESYASYLIGKHVDIYPDNDLPGQKWLDKVLKSLEGKVESIRIVKVPEVYGDIADMITAQGIQQAAELLKNILSKTQKIPKGVVIPLLSAEECYDSYKNRLQLSETQGIDLSKWIPSFKKYIRILHAGDMVVFLSDTGVGKTTVLSNIAMTIKPQSCIFFELELSTDAMCERFLAQDHGISTHDIEQNVKACQEYTVEGWNHVYICPKSDMTISEMENIIIRSELKIGKKPSCVLIDYIGLINGGSASRYERLSNIAESLKILARKTNTVVIVASQIKRNDDRKQVSLHDAKDSGSIENSAQLVIGVNRPDINKMLLKILKNTKRAGHPEIECNFDGDKQKITELFKGNENVYERQIFN